MHSVLTQNYRNFRVIYIDDCSTDGTFEKVKEITHKYNKNIRIDLLRNPRNQGALTNLYYAIHGCKDQEIVVTVDGDDFLAHEEVLKKLNAIYNDSQVWMTYGNFLDYPTYKQKPVMCKKVPKKVIHNNSFRSHEWVTSHLRTFYAGLFKNVKLQDLIYEGQFFPMAWDLAFMLPMLEMSGKHAHFVQDILYLYNRKNPLNDHKIDVGYQERCASRIRKFPRYTRLKALSFEQKQMEMQTDLIIFSYDRPMQLYALLESINHYVSHLGHITLIYRRSLFSAMLFLFF